MPSRIWDEESNSWIIVDEAKFALQSKIIDVEGYYDSDNVEGALKEIGEELNGGGGSIGDLKNQVHNIDQRLSYVEANGGGGSGGGGGGGGNAPYLQLLTDTDYAVATDAEVTIRYQFTSPNLGFGTAYISIDYETVAEETISQGSNFFVVKAKDLEKGEHTVDIYVTDITGLFSNTIRVRITTGGLELSSKFDDSQDLSLEDYITIKYLISTISTHPIEVCIDYDGTKTYVVGEIGENTLDLGQITSLGVHTLTISATSGDLKSNVLRYNLVVADGENLYVTSTFDQDSQIAVGKNLQIDYRNSMLNQTRFKTYLFIDGNLIDTVTSYLGYNYWNVGTSLPIGKHTLSLYSTTMDDAFTSQTLTWDVTVVAEDYVPFEIVQDGLICNFDATTSKSQTSDTRNIWKDESGNNVKCELFNFNYSTNGWIDNSLVMNGKAYAKIDLSPFSSNAPEGLTIDILYKVQNVGDIDGKVLWCKNPVTPYQGVYINTYEANMRSANARMVSTQYQDDTWTRITWVINRDDLTMICYVNGVITKPIYITNTERFTMDKHIYLGASFDEVDDNLDDNGNPIPHYSTCAIRTFRIYNRALTDDEVLQNHIADIKDKEEQLAIRDKNFGESQMPIIKFEGNMEGMTGDVYKLLTIDYNDPLDPEKRFRKEQCKVYWQGTSSLEYPVKNYTMELRSGGNVWEYAPKNNWLPEKRYTLKASFMDSSTYDNVGTAKLVYDYFRKNNMYYPQEIKNADTRSVIDGFPVRLYVNGECKGIYMFNIDRYAENNYGFVGEQSVVSYEIGVNSVSGAGAFADDSWASIRSEFEMRYHYAGDSSVVCETITVDGSPTTVLKAGYHSDLQNLVSWVKNSSIEEFRSELKEHFELNFLIDYYLWVFCLGLVDNLGKNMVLTTFGMNAEGNVIWYPSFYDCDSELGLTNDGELRYGSGIDVVTNNFNTSESLLWTKLNAAFPDEIVARYIHMRSNGYMTANNIIKYFEDVANTVGEKFYNEDARLKYINEDNKNYIYMCNGSRLEHTKRWITERIDYMDSVYRYGDWLLSATIRSNVTGDVTLKFKTFSPQWVEVSFSDSATGTVKKWCDKDTWYEFRNNITNAVDNNITIRGITNVMHIQGLENLNVSSMLLGNARRLCEIDIHGSQRIQRLELGNNEMLQSLNCKGCKKLGYDDNYKVINLEKCVNLKYLDLSDTLIGTVQLNTNGGALEYLDLSNTKIADLVCNFQEYLPEIKLDGCRDLSSVAIRGCNALTRLSLPNTKLSSFRVEDCTKLEYLDISYTGYLSDLDLTGCSNLKTLKMSGVSNSQFTELDARTLTKLEILDISKCDFLSNVRFAAGYKALKSLDVQQSGIRTFQFGYEEIPNFLNLTPFTLNDLNFYNCTQVEHIKGLTLYATKSITPFYNCINLHTIEGSVSLTGAMGRSFYGCAKLRNFPIMDLSRVTSAGESFAGCVLMTYQQMLNILSTMTNCTDFGWTFSGCSGINSNGEIKKEIFANMGKARSLSYTFTGTNITGQLEAGVFDNLTNAVEIIAPFGTGQRITGYIPANLLKYNTELVTFADVFNGSSGLEVATNIDTMFLTNTKLENIYGLFAYCNNAVMVTNENWFANCPKLKNVDNTFIRCYNLMGELKPWFANNPNLVSAHNTFQECTGLSGSIPSNYFQNDTLLSDIKMHFYKCTGLTGSLHTTLWENCPNLVDASYFLSGCSNLGGDASNQQEIPADFFKEKYRLVTIEGIVQGCSSLIFKLQPKWFKDCRSLTTISYAFDGCTGMSGEIPSDIFETHDAEGNVIDTVISGAKGVFKNCLYLYGTIPGNLFEKFLKVRDLSEFFYSCRNLEGGIPDELFANCYSLVYLNATFYQCCKLGKYDEELTEEDPYFCSPTLLLTCTNLQQVNNTWNMYWFGTTMRGEIPPDLFKTCKKLQSASYTWAHCSKLTGGLSGDLFKNAPNLQNASGTFYGCSGLDGEISGSLFSDQANPKLTTFVECFAGDSKLRGYAPTLWSQFSNADRTRCFTGCTSLYNYADIPDAWK